jgi:hypothetical protein
VADREAKDAKKQVEKQQNQLEKELRKGQKNLEEGQERIAEVDLLKITHFNTLQPVALACQHFSISACCCVVGCPFGVGGV